VVSDAHESGFAKPVLTGMIIATAFVVLLTLMLIMLTGLTPGAGAQSVAGDGTSPDGDLEGSVASEKSNADESPADEQDAPPGEADDGPAEVREDTTQTEPEASSEPVPTPKPESREAVQKTDLATFTIAALPTGGEEVQAQTQGSSRGFSDVAERLNRAGASTGDVQLSLAWNNGNDLDLHVIAPGGERIMYRHKKSKCKGVLDVDMNAAGSVSRRPIENIYWPTGVAPRGQFIVIVHHYRNHGSADPTRYHVIAKVDGDTRRFEGSVSRGDQPEIVHRFTRQ